MTRLNPITVENFNRGLVTRFEGESIPRGAASDSLNWMTHGDHIELRGGQALTGTEASGTSEVTGLKVAERFDGTQVPFYAHGRKVKYYDASSDTSTEVGTNTIAAAGDGEQVPMDDYHSLAGAFLYLATKSSSFYKIPVANPGSAVDQSVTDHRGYFRIKQGRTFLWQRKGSNNVEDRTGLYGSYIDKDELSDYTEHTNEVIGTGDGSETNFTGTLTNVSAPKTCHYVRVTDGTETFNDDRNGTLVGDQGGTGTINYATGAVDVTFNTAVSNMQDVTVDYFVEDSTSTGILDFSKSTPRTAGQGFVFRQDDGGAEMQNIGSIGDAEFAIHKKKTWRLTLTSDDTNATNLIFRSRVGIEYWRAMEESGDGIYYVDSLDVDEPFVRLIKPSDFSADKEIPVSISDLIDLTPYRFDKAVVREFKNYVMVACRTKDSSINDRMLFYNKLYQSWDVTDIRASTIDEYGGSLLVGDSGSPNIFTVFSGFTDEESIINNYWISGDDDLDVSGLKVCNRLLVGGLIAPDQNIEVAISLDNSPFVTVFTIDGRADYVDSGNSILIGSPTIGSSQIGGGSMGVSANPYEVDFRITTGLFKRIRVRFKATKVGPATVSRYQFKDTRYKGRRSLSEKTNN